MRPTIIGPILGAVIFVSMAILCWKVHNTSMAVLFVSIALINLVLEFINHKKHPRNSDPGDGGGDWFGDSGSGSHGHGHHDGGGFDGGGHGGDAGGFDGGGGDGGGGH